MIELMDAHTHLTELTVENLESMSLSGIHTIISPGHLNTKRDVYKRQGMFSSLLIIRRMRGVQNPP